VRGINIAVEVAKIKIYFSRRLNFFVTETYNNILLQIKLGQRSEAKDG